MAAAVLVAVTASGLAAPQAVHAAPTAAAPGIPWQSSGNPYAFTVANSIIDNCTLAPEQRAGNSEGIGWRDLGRTAWPGSDTTQQRARMLGEGTWPESTVTEDSNAMERTWFRDAGTLIVELGTNDVKVMDANQYRDNVRWFIERDPGRPVIWINSNNPTYESKIREFNQVLADEAVTHPNLKVLDWHGFLDNGHRWDVRGDGVHPADGFACNDLFTLIRQAMPGVPGDTKPRGYWYGQSRNGNTVFANGWASAWTNPRADVVKVTARLDWRQVGQWLPTALDAGGDDWANASAAAPGVSPSLSRPGRTYCAWMGGTRKTN